MSSPRSVSASDRASCSVNPEGHRSNTTTTGRAGSSRTACRNSALLATIVPKSDGPRTLILVVKGSITWKRPRIDRATTTAGLRWPASATNQSVSTTNGGAGVGEAGYVSTAATSSAAGRLDPATGDQCCGGTSLGKSSPR